MFTKASGRSLSRVAWGAYWTPVVTIISWLSPINKDRDSTDIENRLLVAKGEEGWGGKDWEFGISRCKLLYIEWINNKVLLYSTGNSTQYPVINHNGKEYEK